MTPKSIMMKCYDPADDNNLVQLVKRGGENANDALNQLINRHSGVCLDSVKKYLSSGSGNQEIYNDKDISIYKAALSFEEAKNVKFSTWAGQIMKFNCWRIFNETKNTSCYEPSDMDKLVEEKSNAFGQLKSVENKELIDDIRKCLEEYPNIKVKNIIMDRYFSGGKVATYKELAAKYGCTQQNIHAKHREFIKWIRGKLAVAPKR